MYHKNALTKALFVIYYTILVVKLSWETKDGPKWIKTEVSLMLT